MSSTLLCMEATLSHLICNLEKNYHSFYLKNEENVDSEGQESKCLAPVHNSCNWQIWTSNLVSPTPEL